MWHDIDDCFVTIVQAGTNASILPTERCWQKGVYTDDCCCEDVCSGNDNDED